MLIEVAVSDSYGAGFEFVPQETILKEHKLNKYYASRIDDLKAGQYTDDTQMSLAIAELLINEKEWTKEIVAKYFINVFKRDERCGYAKKFYNFLKSVTDENDFLARIQPQSVRNGAAMRSVPLSIIKDKKELKYKAALQARITHNTFEGIISSQAVALIGNYFLYKQGKKKDLIDYLFKEVNYLFIDFKTGRIPCCAISTIDAVITVLQESDTLSQILNKSVLLGGDTDSVASIACGLATMSNEFINDLPDFLYDDLENEKYGKDYINKLDKDLMKLIIR
jgi:ADP-ribosylglycohydrolase